MALLHPLSPGLRGLPVLAAGETSAMKGSMSRFSFQHSTPTCEICGKPRNRGQGPARHDRCSKIRQQMNAHRHAS